MEHIITDEEVLELESVSIFDIEVEFLNLVRSNEQATCNNATLLQA